MPRRHDLSLALLFVLVVSSGCVGTLTGESLSPNEAKEVALEAEKEHIRTEIRAADCAGGTPGGILGEKQAVITNQTDAGWYVDVEYPYAYYEQNLEADAVSTAQYLVRPNGTAVRVSGTEIVSCDE
jgi:hypothetical protein